MRCQAKAWGDEHRIDIEIAERIYSEDFAGTYAIDISEDLSGTVDHSGILIPRRTARLGSS